MGKRNTTWNDLWLASKDENDVPVSMWCLKVANGDDKAHCKMCRKDFSIAQHGLSALKSHSRSDKHKRAMASRKHVVALPASFLPKEQTTSLDQQQKGSVEVAKAELKWTLHSLEQNHSFLSNDHSVDVFTSMFPDSSIPERMNLKRSKMTYLVTARWEILIRIL
jgi:hypothetical protein